MIAHVVLFRPDPKLSPTNARLFAHAFERAVREIPSIRRVRVGKRVTIGTAYEQLMQSDYPYAAVVEFDNIAGLEAYLAHPAHEDLGLRLFASVEEALVYDFVMEDGAAGMRTLLNEPPDITGADG